MTDDKQTTEDVVIPPAFFRAMSRDEFRQLCLNNGVLNAEQCARLWRMTDRQDEPPRSMTLMVSREDVMRIWPPRKE